MRILLFWYSKQTVCIKWRTCMSDYFCIFNGVRQSKIFSPKLFFVYVDDLSDKLIKSKTGYHKNKNKNKNKNEFITITETMMI